MGNHNTVSHPEEHQGRVQVVVQSDVSWSGYISPTGLKSGNGEECNKITGLIRRGKYNNGLAIGDWLTFNREGHHIFTEKYDIYGNLISSHEVVPPAPATAPIVAPIPITPLIGPLIASPPISNSLVKREYGKTGKTSEPVPGPPPPAPVQITERLVDE
jgi:hypothetical protein